MNISQKNNKYNNNTPYIFVYFDNNIDCFPLNSSNIFIYLKNFENIEKNKSLLSQTK
jgi:hypothetical protein